MEASQLFSDPVTSYVAETLLSLYSIKLLLLSWASEILEKVNQQEQVNMLKSKYLVLQIYIVPCIILIILKRLLKELKI